MSIREQLSNERKQLQKDGRLPDWFTTQGWSLFKQKYAVPGEDAFLGRAKTIAKTAARHAPKDGRDWESEFFKLIWNGWLSCSTPVLSNMGTNRGMPVSCSGQVIPDSITGFYTTLHNAAMLSKMGFGTSGYLGKIRSRGTKISTGGTAQGVLPVLQDFVTMSSKVSQGGTRRGSWAGYLPISHGDFQEVYDFIKDQPDEVNVGWNWYNADVQAMNNGDPETTRRFKAMMKLRAIQGKGYIFKPDTANKHRPQMYVDHNLFVEASNLCLTGDTIIEVANNANGAGAVEFNLAAFCELYQFGYFAGRAFVKSYDTNSQQIVWANVAAAAKTGVAKTLVKITLPSGKIVKCTPDHEIYTTNRGWVKAKDLVETDELVED